MRWLRPLGSAASAVARGMFLLNRAIMRGLFRLRAEGLENLPDGGQFIIAPNHVSYLDAFVVAAALPQDVLRRTYWAGWTGGLRQPADPSRQPPRAGGPRRSRAAPDSRAWPSGPRCWQRGQNLVWFAEGERSRTGRPAAVQARCGHAVGSLPGAGRTRVHSWHVRGHAEGEVLAQVGEGHGQLRRAIRPRGLMGTQGPGSRSSRPCASVCWSWGTPMNGDGDNKTKVPPPRAAGMVLLRLGELRVLHDGRHGLPRPVPDRRHGERRPTRDGLRPPARASPSLAGSYFPYVLSLSVVLQVFVLPLTARSPTGPRARSGS